MSADLTTGAIGDARPTQAPPAEAAVQPDWMHGLTFTENGGPPTLHLTDAAWLTGAGLPNAIETKLHVSGRNPSQASTCSTIPTAFASVTDVSASMESVSSVESHDSMETRPDAGTREARV